MVGPNVKPDSGITNYFRDHTQGPACAFSCPAETLYRHYFVNGGRGQCDNQIDSTEIVVDIIGNEENDYWRMSNGYLLPRKGKMAELGQRLSANSSLAADVVDNFKVGVHWNTELKLNKKLGNRKTRS